MIKFLLGQLVTIVLTVLVLNIFWDWRGERMAIITGFSIVISLLTRLTWEIE